MQKQKRLHRNNRRSDYKFSDLTDDNKVLVNHIRDLDAQVEQLNFRFEQLNASKNFFQTSYLVFEPSKKAV